MARIDRGDVLDSFVPGREMSTFQVTRMLALRGCLDDDGPDDEARVRRMLSQLSREGRVVRGGRAPDGTYLWMLTAQEPSSRRRQLVA